MAWYVDEVIPSCGTRCNKPNANLQDPDVVSKMNNQYFRNIQRNIAAILKAQLSS